MGKEENMKVGDKLYYVSLLGEILVYVVEDIINDNVIFVWEENRNIGGTFILDFIKESEDIFDDYDEALKVSESRKSRVD